jgi:hypothetical protein
MGAFKGAARQGGGFNWGNAALGFFGGEDAVQALRLRQEAQRERQRAGAQQEAAAALGFSKDEIASMTPEALSWAVHQRIAARDLAGGEQGENGGAAAPYDADAAMLHMHGKAAAQYAPPPGRPQPDPAFAQTSSRFIGSPRLDDEAAPGTGILQAGVFAAPRSMQMATLADIPRVRTHAQAASLARGTRFFAPDGSLREIV